MVIHLPYARRSIACGFWLLLMLGLASTLGTAHAHAACDDLIPSLPSATRPQRSITVEDLARLRDIGQPDISGASAPRGPLALSPDGQHVAFVLSRADPDTNLYCRAVVVLSLQHPGVPRIVDRGGDMIINSGPRNGVIVEIGYPVLITPVWSPDGRWIAYLRRDDGVTQIWRARADGTHSGVVTHSRTDVDALAWRRDGGALVYATAAGRSEAELAVDREGRGGWNYDARILPYLSARPRVSESIPSQASVVDVATGRIQVATPDDAALLPTFGPPAATSHTGRRAWTSRSATTPFGALRLFATDAAGHTAECRAASCDGGFTGLWWDAGGQHLLFLRFEGWHGDQMALYRWRPGAGAPRRVLAGHTVLDGCILAMRRLLCLRENATTPRQLVSIDPATGAVALLFEPNPEFAAIALGTVERLHWRNANGLEGWGDLVLPPAYRSGDKLPMVVVQYRSQGFLRGGTGDEYPIHALAAHGFAVLSVERVADYADSLPNVRTVDEANAADLKDWAEMKNQVSSIIAGIAQVRARGIVDPARIGITGLSAGAMSAKFALLNTDLFAAASISGNSLEPRTIMTYTGTAFADTWRSYGFPSASGDDPDLWRPFSLAQNAATMNTPILFQVADDEYLLALEAFAALREHQQPVDLFIFPGEHHEKWQPAHRLAIYRRNVDWFDFWLRDYRDPDPTKAAQYQRWEALRRSRLQPGVLRGGA